MSAATDVGGTPAPDNRPDVFGEFCAAGLWPGLGRALAGQLAGAGITAPELVTADRLELIDGMSGERAEWLAASFLDARPCYETAQLLTACQVPARFARPAVAMLGRSAEDQLRQDPWRLLAVPQIRPDQADWFARKLLGGQASPQDPRRGRALVSYLLARAARDGHTAVPAGVIATALARFRIEDPAAAIAAAVEEGGVLPFEADPGEDAGLDEGEPPDGDGPGDADDAGGAEGATAGILLALARYAMAEETVAEGLQRLAALAEPLDDAGPDGSATPAALTPAARTPAALTPAALTPAALARMTRPDPARTPATRAIPPRARTSARPRAWTRSSRPPCGWSPGTGCPSSPAARGPARAGPWRRWWRWPPSAA